MAISARGFASMSPARQRAIASLGGKAAHQKGTAHQWTREEAREAGRKGGLRSKRDAGVSNTTAGALGSTPKEA